MRRFLLINSFLSSLLLLLGACSPAAGYKLSGTSLITEKEVEPVISKTSALLYKARIRLYNRDFSGLILLKQLDPEVSHLTFVTEIGMKMFDFEIRNNTFRLVYVFEPLNKPKIIHLLESDMKLILLQHLLNQEAAVYKKGETTVLKTKNGSRYYYTLNTGARTVKKSLKKGALFTQVKVNYTYSNTDNPSQIRLKHKGLVRLKIELNNLHKTE